jgi:hypothetical protein
MNVLKGLIFLLILSSCVEVGFRQPLPTNGKLLTEIPQEILDFYRDNKSDSTKNDSNGLKINDYYNDQSFENSLSENTILKKWKGKYFLNQKEDSLWHIIMIVPKAKSKFETYRLDGGNEKTINLLKKITKVKEIYDDEGELELLILDPSKKQFNKIVKSGAFEIIEIF